MTDENNAAFGSAQADKLSSVSTYTYIPTRWFLFMQLFLMWWFLLSPCNNNSECYCPVHYSLHMYATHCTQQPRKFLLQDILNQLHICKSEINPNLQLAWETYVLLRDGKSEYYWRHQHRYHFHKLCSILWVIPRLSHFTACL